MESKFVLDYVRGRLMEELGFNPISEIIKYTDYHAKFEKHLNFDQERRSFCSMSFLITYCHCTPTIFIAPVSKKALKNMDTPYDHKNGYHTTVDGVPVRKIYVANLPITISSNELLSIFQIYGRIHNVNFLPPSSNKLTTFGFVTFVTPHEASRAIREKYIFLKGRKLYVSPADSWHQPLELPNGKIIWDRRKTQRKAEEEDTTNNDEEDDEEVGEEEESLVVNSEETCPIEKLNDDCLHLIFNHLKISDRVIIGHVCRRWRKVNESMWHGIRKLDFSSPPLSEITLTDNLLQLYLSLCPNITSLNIANSVHNLKSGAIVTVAKSCRFLEELTLRNISIQKRSLALLAQYCPNLIAFYMNACTNPHDNEMITLVKKCKNLRKIGLKFSTSSSGSWLKHLRCPLQSLSLEMYDMNPDYLLQGISRVNSTLKELSFISCPTIRCSDLNAIFEMVPNLTFLTLAGMFSLIPHNALLPITKLKNLIRLDLKQNSIVCDEFMKELVENCPSLVHLNLSGTDHYHLTEKGLMLVSKFSNLTHLRLAYHSTLNDAILKTMSLKMKNLKHLDIVGCRLITDKGCIDIITNCTQLESLDVSGCFNITNSSVLAAIKLAESVRRKKFQIIAGGTQVDPDILIIKEELRPYIHIDLQTTSISHSEAYFESDYENSDFDLDDYDLINGDHYYFDVDDEYDPYYGDYFSDVEYVEDDDFGLI